MKKVPVNNIVSKIHKEKGISIEEINESILKKVEELSGLVSEEGAAHIIANELGVQIFGETELKIKDIMPNMRNITVIGKITDIYDLVEFQKDSNPGKVRSIIIGDETGKIRVSFWHHAVEPLESIAVGTVVKLDNVQSRDNNGRIELSVSQPESLVKQENVTIDVSENKPQTQKIVELQTGQGSILGTVVQLFKPTFYDRCSECGKKVTENKCATHGKVLPKVACVLNAFVDDGSASMRCVFFNETAEKLIEMSLEDLKKMEELETLKSKILGKIVKLTGTVRFSSFVGENELVVNRIDNIDIDEELKSITK